MESIRQTAVFCGENPQIILLQPGTETVTAAASYWRCTYSEYGEGNVLLMAFTGENIGLGAHPALAIYNDNPPLARFLTDAINRYFDGWREFDFAPVIPQTARFFQESDSRRYHRVVCHAENQIIELDWRDIRTHELRTFPDSNGGGYGINGDEHYDVITVICLCADGSITVNGQRATGEIQARTLESGYFSSSVFLAFSETWVKHNKG